MVGFRHYHAQRSKSDTEGEISYDTPYMWNLRRNDKKELIYKTKTDPHA